MNRPLTTDEYKLTRWLLEHGKPEALNYLSQLDKAHVTSWRCPCGCASIDLAIDGCPAPSAGMNTLADFVFGKDEEICGIFAFAQNGILSGLEVYGMAGDASRFLPSAESLRPIESTT
jgi:hypothetical protein